MKEQILHQRIPETLVGHPSDGLMDQMANYVASGWKRDLAHFIGCCWAAQIGSLDRDEWHVAIQKFLGVMAKWKASEWTNIKELMPLQFMPYMAKLFREVTGQDLQGLSQFTGWISQGSYYHWPKLGLQLWEPLGSDRTGPNQPPVEADRDPPRTRVDSRPPPARAE